jgi:CHASE2 domain-containing sensor protein
MSRPALPDTPLRLHPLWEGRRLLLFTGLILTLCTALLLIYRPKFVQQTELRLYDAMLTDGASPPKTAVPVLVGVDEPSLAAYGQWPWPRYRLALLVRRIRELGAEVIALDVLMPEPDRTAPEVIGAERDRDLGHPPAAAASLRQDSNSQRLARELSGSNVILGYYFNFSGNGGAGGQEFAVPPRPGDGPGKHFGQPAGLAPTDGHAAQHAGAARSGQRGRVYQRPA